MTKRPRAAAGAHKAGNVDSGESAAPARPWTKDEMDAAKPFPLPTVEPPAKVPVPGLPHSGKGEMKPGGRPEGEGTE